MHFYQKLFGLVLELSLPAKYILNVKQLQADYTPFIKNPPTNSLEFIWVATEYTPEIKQIINQAKTRGYYNLITTLIDNLILQIANDTACKNTVNNQILTLQDIWPNIVTFVPPDPLRYRIRGYHLPIIITKKLSKTLKAKYLPLAKKQKSTQSQSELTRASRLSNLENKFIIDNDKIIEAQLFEQPVIWLIDDISTTGSTLIAVADTIKKQLPNSLIYGVVLSGGSDD